MGIFSLSCDVRSSFVPVAIEFPPLFPLDACVCACVSAALLAAAFAFTSLKNFSTAATACSSITLI
jgi:hypothetical protein